MEQISHLVKDTQVHQSLSRPCPTHYLASSYDSDSKHKEVEVVARIEPVPDGRHNEGGQSWIDNGRPFIYTPTQRHKLELVPVISDTNQSWSLLSATQVRAGPCYQQHKSELVPVISDTSQSWSLLSVTQVRAGDIISDTSQSWSLLSVTQVRAGPCYQ